MPGPTRGPLVATRRTRALEPAILTLRNANLAPLKVRLTPLASP